MSNNTEMRKFLNVISENGPLAPGQFDIDPAMDDPMDDVATTGPETKIEITMKDGEEVEVEVYAQQGEELKRLMDLAGMFHKDKQSGTLGGEAPIDVAPEMPVDDFGDMAPINGGPDVPPGTDMGMEPDVDMGMEPDVDMGMEPDVDMGMEPEVDMGMEPEVDFDVSDETSGMYEQNLKKTDYGYPNPELGQEDYELKAFDFSGGASKPVRAIPARSGDNPMVNMSDKKSLKTYMQEVDSKKKS